MQHFPPYGMQINVEKAKVMRISRQPSPIQIMIDQEQLQNVEHFSYLGNMITNDARCTWEIKHRISMANAAFNKEKKKTVHQHTGLKFKEETSKVPKICVFKKIPLGEKNSQKLYCKLADTNYCLY
jgi:hypothetical protein